MKKLLQATGIIFIASLFISATNVQNTLVSQHNCAGKNKPTTSPRVVFKKQWVDFDVYEGSAKGMRIHVSFTIYEMMSTDCYMLVTFEKKEGEKYFYLEARSDDYADFWGNLMIAKKMTPCCTETDYNDLQVFMPYDELNLTSGRYDLRMDVDVSKSDFDNDSEDKDFIGHLNYYTFWYNKN